MGIRKVLRRGVDALFAFATEGLEPAQVRQVNVVTVTTLLAIVIIPSFAPVFALYDYSRLGLAIQMALIMPLPLFVPLLLLGLRRHTAAKVVLAILVNINVAIFTYIYSIDSGVHYNLFSAALISFLIFDKSQKALLILFSVEPAIIYVYASHNFVDPHPLFNVDQYLLEILYFINSIVVFFVICLITYIFYNLVQRAEEKLERFSAAVSEYLDPDLVDRLRDGADLEPRVTGLTVFFADLVGSTRLSFAMEREDYGHMINDYVGAMQTIIKSHGAYIEDISGDGILGYFGNFQSLGAEGDAERCVHMALEMTARLEDLVPGFKDRYRLPEDLRMRIGISAGEAMVGKTEGARAIYTANGDVVNLGAKLEQKVKEVSPRGGILLSAEAGERVAGRYRLQEHTLDVEGERISAYSVLGPA